MQNIDKKTKLENHTTRPTRMAHLAGEDEVSLEDIFIDIPTTHAETDPWLQCDEDESRRFWTEHSLPGEEQITISQVLNIVGGDSAKNHGSIQEQEEQSRPPDRPQNSSAELMNRFLRDSNHISSQEDNQTSPVQDGNPDIARACNEEMHEIVYGAERLSLFAQNSQNDKKSSGLDGVSSEEESSDSSESDTESDVTIIAQEANTGNNEHLHDSSVINFLKRRDNQYRVSRTNKENQIIAEGALRIVKDLFSELKPRFHANILPSGSYYEGLKVGKPDEFDFMAEIKSLSKEGVIDAVASDRPGFMHVAIKNKESLKEWKDCVAFICKHGVRADSCKKGCGDASIAEEGGTLILAPEKVQEKLRAQLDEAMEKVTLPQNWQHAGCSKPQGTFSGYRRHGPATLFQFKYHRGSGKRPYKITLDVTLSIGMSPSVNPYAIHFRPLSGVYSLEKGHPLRKLLTEYLRSKPCLHLIPLYSKLHVRTSYFGNKNCWRLSCSLLERVILDEFDPSAQDCSIPKRIIRLLKWLRDKYLTDKGKQKTPKGSRKSKESKDAPQEDREMETQDQSGFIVDDDIPLLIENFRKVFGYNQSCPSPNVEEFGGEDVNSKPNIKEIFTDPTAEESEITTETGTTITAGGVEEEPGVFLDIDRMVRHTMDIREPKTLPHDVQNKEVEELKQKPPRGEFYGPITYVTSIELKTLVLNLIEQFPSREDWNEAQMADIIYSIYKALYTFYITKQMVANFFFEIPVCAPPTENKWLTAVEKLKHLNLCLRDWTPILMSIRTKAYEPHSAFTPAVARRF